MRSNRTCSYLAFTLPLALVLTSGCWRRTELATVWHEPGPTMLNFKRTVAVFASTDESMRRSVEDQLSCSSRTPRPPTAPSPMRPSADKETILPAAARLRVRRSDRHARDERLGARDLQRHLLGPRIRLRRLLGLGVGLSVRSVLRERDPDRLRRDEHLLAEGRQARLRRAQRDVQSLGRGQAHSLRHAAHQRRAQEERHDRVLATTGDRTPVAAP